MTDIQRYEIRDTRGCEASGGDWVSYADHVLAVEEMKKIIDEADRRAGAAERQLAHLKDGAAKRERWKNDAKRQRGYEEGVSFDRVWEATCKLADQALAEGGESDGWKLVPPKVTYEMKAAAFNARLAGGNIADEWEAMLAISPALRRQA